MGETMALNEKCKKCDGLVFCNNIYKCRYKGTIVIPQTKDIPWWCPKADEGNIKIKKRR
jgi:hypothetical protein